MFRTAATPATFVGCYCGYNQGLSNKLPLAFPKGGYGDFNSAAGSKMKLLQYPGFFQNHSPFWC